MTAQELLSMLRAGGFVAEIDFVDNRVYVTGVVKLVVIDQGTVITEILELSPPPRPSQPGKPAQVTTVCQPADGNQGSHTGLSTLPADELCQAPASASQRTAASGYPSAPGTSKKAGSNPAPVAPQEYPAGSGTGGLTVPQEQSFSNACAACPDFKPEDLEWIARQLFGE